MFCNLFALRLLKVIYLEWRGLMKFMRCIDFYVPEEGERVSLLMLNASCTSCMLLYKIAKIVISR